MSFVFFGRCFWTPVTGQSCNHISFSAARFLELRLASVYYWRFLICPWPACIYCEFRVAARERMEAVGWIASSAVCFSAFLPFTCYFCRSNGTKCSAAILWCEGVSHFSATAFQKKAFPALACCPFSKKLLLRILIVVFIFRNHVAK